MGVFFRREVVFGNQLWGDGGFGHGKINYLNFSKKKFNREPRQIREKFAKIPFRVFGVFRGYQFRSLFS
jgi:hypothetical protein